MPKTNQIPYLTPSRRTPGATYHWKPSPKLRRLGFTNQKLGSEWDVAVAAAIGHNQSVDRWLADNQDVALPRSAPRIMRWRDLVTAYQADPAFLDLKPKSQAEYASRIRTLDHWALDGALRLSDLTREMIVGLRNTLVKDPRKHRTAALLRVLRVVVNFAVGQGWLARGLADDLDIPEVKPRGTVIAPGAVEALAARAEAEAMPALALAIRLGFWTLQRESDLLALTRFHWRELKELSAFARKTLAGADGTVMGFRLQQAKTGAWIHVPLPPPLRAAVDAAWAAQQRADAALLSREAGGAPWPAWAFQRAFRRICEAEGMPTVQFRDLRRSGMVYAGELGVEIQFITARSGHTVLGHKRTILDTYMPGNSRVTAEGVAIQWQRHLEREQSEQQEQAN
jgi:integrase